MKKFIKHNPLLLSIFIILISISIFFRFYNLNWGTPYYFHPDERNIASSITRLEFPGSMNPEFFAYGSFPIYTSYFIGVGSNFISSIFTHNENLFVVNFEQAIIILRILSALLSVFIIFLIFDLVKKSLNLKYAILASSLTGLNVGLIQYSHFGTFEIWLTFFFLVLLKFLYEYCLKPQPIWIMSTGIILGLLFSIKVSSLVVAPIAVLVILFIKFENRKNFKKLNTYIYATVNLLLLFSISVITTLAFSPFIILDSKSFLGSMNYESAVALGTIQVFYTGGFVNTIPIIYQLFFVYPFILNPLNLVLILALLPLVLLRIFKKRELLLGLTVVFFLIVFFSQAFFYVKWIRYYIPTSPFLIIILIFGIKEFINLINKKHQVIVFNIIFTVLLFVSLIYSISYVKTVLINDDTRISASEFAKKNLPSNSIIISEIYDLGIVPFNKNFSNITLFDFYSLDDKWSSETRREELLNLTENSDYFILPSQRVLRNRTLNNDKFPEGYSFYSSLNEKYELIYRTECDLLCKLLYIGDSVYSVEETTNVFDRPEVSIYKLKK